jgi:hypothetical protein
MLTEHDIRRMQALYEIDRESGLPTLVAKVVAEMRANGVGQQRDPTTIPLVARWQSLYQFLYQPPSPPTREEIIYALFPSEKMAICDRLLKVRD